MRILTGFFAILSVWVTSAQASDIITTRNLPRGNIIAAADLHINSANYDQVAGFVGMQLSRTVYQGHKLQLTDIEKPVLIKRNAIVAMTYRYGDLVIKTYGRSLGQGANGDLIQVLNTQSKKKVQAVIDGPDSVRVQL